MRKDYNIVIVEDDTLSRFTLKKMVHQKITNMLVQTLIMPKIALSILQTIK